MATAADIMTRDVMTVTPETPVGDVADLLASQRFGSVPVVTSDGTVVGIVTEEDLVERAASVHLPRHITFLGSIIYLDNPQHFEAEAGKILAVTAREIMDEQFRAVRPEMTVDELAEYMLNDDLRRVLVLNEEGRLLGIITRADIVRMQITGGRLPSGQISPPPNEAR